MKTLSGVAASPVPSGECLPTVFQSLARANIKPRRGNVTLVCAPGGTGKTLFMVYYVGRMGLPTLYFSADTDENTILERARHMLGEHPLDRLGHIRWVFSPDPTYDDLQQELLAYAEVYGDWPAVVVVDNIINVVGENEDEWGTLRDHTRAFKTLCHLTNAGVFALHHQGDPDREYDHPLPRNKIQGRISQLPGMILALRMEGNKLQVACEKQRWGPSDPSGRTFVELYVRPQTSTFYDSWQAFQAGTQA